MTTQQTETKEFQAQTEQLLDLMINSIYTNQEIFLRELISNASDAIDKIKFKALTEPELIADDSEFEINLEVDQENNLFIISDNGIGMTYEDVIENIGTIAQSGTKEFLRKLKQDKENIDLIGQFGVGFYSSFMVAEKVTLITKAVGEEAVKWESTGDGTYSIEDAVKKERGTTIKLKLREEFTAQGDEEDFTDPQTIKNLVKQYSNYVRYPITMEVPTEEGTEVQTLNSMTPLWKKNEDEVSEEEYTEFYKRNFTDWQEPLETIHWSVEGLVKFTGLLFIPQTAPNDLFSPDFKTGIKLYSKDNLIMEECQELLPNYLQFVKGLIDSPDFSLNISREMLQNNKQLKVIAKNAEKVILRNLKKMLNNQREKYEKFWQEFGKAIKGGIYSNPDKQDKLVDLLLFSSSHLEEEKTTLAEYVERMPEEQESIYYVVGQDRTSIENLPQMELVQDKDLEVLYLLDEVAEFVINILGDYQDFEFKSVLREDLDLEDESETEEEEEVEGLLEKIKEHLADKVDDVRLSKRLKSSAVCLVSGQQGLSMSMEKVFNQMEQNLGQAQRILELNPNHQLFTTLQEIYNQDPEAETLQEYSELLYNLSSLVEGFTPEDPVEFTTKITDLMSKAK
ncbi:molecular chaperone HtpG [Natroniella sulfidigena]|uniref:molecular chaperone HtpG n=1 Tax=Natroniella sulfidigena TaxID=723921 RepID=UPI00200A2F57|nr:molecular chaperone HtpG [Natroniella sulfidigena]MCK8817222.1 molecular chaperone HtpG [Natroniella sulfidigena]